MVTRKDIADRLGVSVSVVSRALNNSGYVDPAKKEKILNAAREMGYSREPSALKASGRSNRLITVFTANTRNPFYVEFIQGVRDGLEQLGYSMIVCQLPCTVYPDRSLSDGVVFANEAIAYRYLNEGGRNDYRPAVAASFAGYLQLPRHITMVEFDMWKGAEKAIDYLRRNGHRKIAMVSPFPRNNPDSRIHYWAAEMYEVFGPEISRYYLEVSDKDRAAIAAGSLVGGGEGLTALTAEDYFENGYLAAARFADSGCDATAVVCFNEEMGVGFCKGLRKQGIRVPADLSVIAYDGTYLRRYMETSLTVLSLQPYRMGRECAEAVVQLVNGNKVRSQKVSLMEILEGETVADIRNNLRKGD